MPSTLPILMGLTASLAVAFPCSINDTSTNTYDFCGANLSLPSYKNFTYVPVGSSSSMVDDTGAASIYTGPVPDSSTEAIQTAATSQTSSASFVYAPASSTSVTNSAEDSVKSASDRIVYAPTSSTGVTFESTAAVTTCVCSLPDITTTVTSTSTITLSDVGSLTLRKLARDASIINAEMMTLESTDVSCPSAIATNKIE